MTFWDLYVFVIIVIYLAAFFVRNLKTYFNVKTSIRGKSLKLSISLALSTIIYCFILVQLFFPNTQNYFGKLSILQSSLLLFFGYGVIFIAMLIGLLALFEMKSSWRVGIKLDQKTDLVTTGIYTISRNPYFLSYNLLFIGLFLIYPSLILLVLIICLGITFHFMILEEETYLERVQGGTYLKYKQKTGRYLLK